MVDDELNRMYIANAFELSMQLNMHHMKPFE